MYNRLYIEKSILGAIVYCNGYSQVGHILSANNFSSQSLGNHRYKEVYEIIITLYPARPIDFISIANEIRIKYPEDLEVMESYLNLGSKVCSATNIVYWSFILLQIDISEKFKNNLITWYHKRENELEYVEAGALKEIIESINPDADIFDVIEGASRYFKHLNMEVELKTSLEFYQQLAIKVRNLKTVTTVQTALNYLFQISEASPEVKFECKIFASAIAVMITTKESNPKFTEAANLISN